MPRLRKDPETIAAWTLVNMKKKELTTVKHQGIDFEIRDKVLYPTPPLMNMGDGVIVSFVDSDHAVVRHDGNAWAKDPKYNSVVPLAFLMKKGKKARK
jgi:hypothetical protein